MNSTFKHVAFWLSLFFFSIISIIIMLAATNDDDAIIAAGLTVFVIDTAAINMYIGYFIGKARERGNKQQIPPRYNN